MSGLSYGGFTLLTSQQGRGQGGGARPGGTAALRPGNIAIPAMVIGSERDQTVGYAESENAYARLAGPRYLELLGGNHLSVVDDCVNLRTGSTSVCRATWQDTRTVVRTTRCPSCVATWRTPGRQPGAGAEIEGVKPPRSRMG
jgi:hypothetical protein